MNLKSFLKYVEIQTKVASVMPFILGTLYAFYRFNSFKASTFIIMFISLITFDMTTTAINNYIDFKKANKKEGYGYEEHNALVKDGIKESTAVAIIIILLAISICFGIILTIKTNTVVLLIGVLSFFIGIFYTFGPVPISRMPLGEAFSGFFMGFIILFLAVYIQVFDKNIVSIAYANNILSLSLNIIEILLIFIVSIPTIGGIANIMLANNICDVEDDIVNNRFTLPYYIGRKNALNLFAFLYYIGYAAIIISVILKVLPAASLLVIITLMPVYKNIKIFSNNPVKGETFVFAVKNLLIINLSHIFILTVTIMYKIF
ncbi:1,4-dihydroxy-2-naphthoate polyprenyltransferase [Candidatus Clostridium radicumherbarum]|uniref:1,4-dihydroxy-2-naphthoate polyprenyltransferase n=1 Tax=Candidatus Clostridium radicumherbarum TaxID=3381662 RepID=A0ABW8TYF6_9CLOT